MIGLIRLFVPNEDNHKHQYAVGTDGVTKIMVATDNNERTDQVIIYKEKGTIVYHGVPFIAKTKSE